LPSIVLCPCITVTLRTFLSSTRACHKLVHSGFHEVLPVFSILSVFPCWVEAEVKRLEGDLLPGCVARYEEDVRVGVSNPWAALWWRLWVLWWCQVTYPSLPRVQKIGAVWPGWAETAAAVNFLVWCPVYCGFSYICSSHAVCWCRCICH